jgi:hypothetical protein
MKLLKLEGKRFGKLVVQDRADSKKGKTVWRCLCDCGQVTTVVGYQLTAGKTRSCGCLKLEVLKKPRKHGQSHRGQHTRAYRIWRSLFKRCYNSNSRYYYRYGGRGIEVDPRWFDFVNFYADMGDCPENKTLERVNNSRNYWKGNCVWATQKQQTRNTSANKKVYFQGQWKCITEWAEMYGKNANLIYQRIVRLGWTPERALTAPVRPIRSGPSRNCHED